MSSHSPESDIEAINEFTIYLEKLAPVVDTMRHDTVLMDRPSMRFAMESLEAQLQHARSYASPNIGPNKPIREVTKELGQSLGRLLLASIGVSLDLKEKIGSLHKELMMGVKFDDDEIDEIKEIELEIEEVGDDEELCRDKSMGVEDVILKLKYGNENEFRSALLGLDILIREKVVGCEWFIDEGIISILFNRLGTSKCVERFRIIKVLRSIAHEEDQCKDKMSDANMLTTLVKSLARDELERREAVGLLNELSHLPNVRRRVGRIQGCIIMLVSIMNGHDSLASCDANKLLTALSCNTQNALLMAEAGYFHPLIQHLMQGSEMSKILMATTLSRMTMTDKTRASLGETGAIRPLAIMFKTGKLEAKLSALNALQNLSKSTQNIFHIVNSGILAPLLQLLFSVTSSLMTLREPASAILAKMTESESILEHKDYLPDQLLSLLNVSSPKIKSHVLVALNNIASHPRASEVRTKMTQNGAMQLLIPFLDEPKSKIREHALSLLYTISKDSSADQFAEVIGETYAKTVVGIVASSSSEVERVAAVGLLSNIPVTDKRATETLKRENLLSILVSLMVCSSSISPCLEENIAGIFIRFTVPSDKKLQMYAVETGILPVLMKLLSNGSIKSKSRASISLTQLSENSLARQRPRNARWGCVPSHTDAYCEVHDGFCTAKGNFCLAKVGAVPTLIQVLEGHEREADDAVLSALGTLLQDDIWENGSNFIAKISGGVEAVVRVLEVGTLEAKEKALWTLGRILRVEDYMVQYGGLAQVVLIDLAHNGEPSLRPAVAKLLAQLELLQNQSTYF